MADARAAGTMATRDVGDIEREELIRLREWLRLYKTVEGKGENEFANEGQPVDSATAVSVIMHTHHQWRGCGPLPIRESILPTREL